MRKLPRFLFIFTLFASTATLEGAESYYTWVDKNGVTNYSERKPGGIEASYVGSQYVFGEKINSAPVENTPFPLKVGPGLDPDALVAEETERLRAKISQAKRSNCEIGKRNLAQLQAYRRIRVSDEKGENRILSSEEKADKTEQARSIILENC